MKFLFALLLLPLLPINPTKYLNDIKGFGEDSFFKHEVYTKADWQRFEELPEVNEKVNADQFNLHVMNACLFYASNKLRLMKKSPMMNNSEALRNAALVHTNEMVTRNFYSHINAKNSELRAPDQRMKLFGITNVLMAENIHDYPFLNNEVTYLQLAQKIMDDFYKSEGHRQNLLNKSFNYTGCAAMPYSDGKSNFRFVKVTQCFVRM